MTTENEKVIEEQVYLRVSKAIDILWGASAWLDNSRSRERDPLLRDAIAKLEILLDSLDEDC